MAKCYSLVFIFLVIFSHCKAQQTACFKDIPNSGLQFEANIDFSQYDAFFVGEFHGVYGKFEIELALIKYLNRQYGITDVFMEASYSAAYLYNAYLASGDTSFLVNPAMIYFMKQPGKEFWKNLYEYNRGLEHKITIKGMDFERIEFLKALKLLMPPGKAKPTEISAVLMLIDTMAQPELERIHTPPCDAQNLVYERIRQDMELHRDVYERYYGGNFKTVAEIMFNAATYSGYDNRNKTMYDNMVKQIEGYRIRKFITFAGLNHGGKSYIGWKSLCYRLSKNRMFKNKLADIAMACKNCYDWQLPQTGAPAYRAANTYYKDTLLMNSIYEKYYNRGCKYTMLPTSVINDSKVQKFSGFLILMKGQPEY